jgi:dTDP-4-amino-4,6-dideoxygalactose transaminase
MAIARQRITLAPATWRQALAGLGRGDLWEGGEIARAEEAFAEFIGAPAAVGVPSARAGLRFIFQALDLQPGDEVICSAFGYPIVPFLVKSLGFDLKFADCEMTTLGLDPEALSEVISERTRAVIITHLYGVPCRVDEIASIAEAHGAQLIEDCAHCYGASVGGRKVGAFGAAAYFSFETSKMINTMGGGMVTVDDPALAERIRKVGSKEPQKDLNWLAKRLFKTTFEATVTHPLVFNLGVYQALRFAPRGKEGEDRFASGYHGDEVSMAGRLGKFTNYQARLALAQMERIGSSGARRNENAVRLIGQLEDVVQFQQPAGPEVTANYMLVTALFENMKEVSAALLRRGIDTKHLYMRDCTGMFEGSESFVNAARAEREILHLPAYPQLSSAQIDRIAVRTREVVTTL